MSKLICISAGQLKAKKVDNAINRQHRYLNYGLLSLATVLSKFEFDPIVLHGHFDPPDVTLRIAQVLGLNNDVSPTILISLPSFYAVEWARLFMAYTLIEHPKARFIVGGRWVVGDHPERIKALLPYANIVSAGLAEGKIVDLIRGRPPLYRSEISEQSYLGSPILDYRLLHEREKYQPSIEVSRGCGMGCSFCQERSERLQPLKAPVDVVNELQATLLQDSLVEMTPYFEASMFVPTRGWAQSFREALDAKEFSVQWRTEGRVDNIRPEIIPELAAAGLTVLDLGLESASPLQLQRMQKTKSPKIYLERASRLIEACARNNVKVKVNLLLFAGETDVTIDETLCWLDARRDQFYGVSAGPVIAFGWPEEIDSYVEELKVFGASKHSSPCFGVAHLNLSHEIGHDRAQSLSRDISRRYMTAERYYALKSFSYFSRDYLYGDFLRDVLHSPDNLTFETASLMPLSERQQPNVIETA